MSADNKDLEIQKQQARQLSKSMNISIQQAEQLLEEVNKTSYEIPHTVKLEYGVDDNEDLKEIVFSKPLTADMMRAFENSDLQRLPYEKVYTLVSEMSGVPYDSIIELDYEDLSELVNVVTFFVTILPSRITTIDTSKISLPYTISLSSPVKLGKEKTISEITFKNRLKGKDFVGMSAQEVLNGTFGDTYSLIGRMTGELPQTIERVSWNDMTAILAIFRYFLLNGRKTGEK